ncbi:MAG: hypothetical protein LBS44_03065, partial [Deltaproteobacteria bacterium]|nr:hypothetical protein [Deltaproteobacteria bacterium]
MTMIKKPIMTVAKVFDLVNVCGPNYLLTLEIPEGPLASLGRFVRLRSWPEPYQGPGTLLDRPFSIHRSRETSLDFLIRQVGPATNLLTSLAKGQPVKVIGPLGRGLDDLVADYNTKKWYLVAGGAGLGTMASLIEALQPAAKLYYGERSGQYQVHPDLVKQLTQNFTAVTEDATGYGQKGLVTQPLIED